MSFFLPGQNAQCTEKIKQTIKTSHTENSFPSSHSTKSNLKLGPGLTRSGDFFSPLFVGSLANFHGTRFVLEHEQKTYFPVIGDSVIGIVKGVYSEHYRVDIGYHVNAILDHLAFEGATRKNRPQLTIGSIVYCRIVFANRDIEPEVSCVAECGKSNGYGLLASEGAYCTEISSLLAKSLLFDPGCCLVKGISKEKMSFEMAVGINGMVWMRGGTEKETHFLVLLFICVQKRVKWWGKENLEMEKIVTECINEAKRLSLSNGFE